VNRRSVAVVAAAVFACHAPAQEPSVPLPAADVGRPIVAIVDELRAAGLPLAYSTALLTPALTVRAAPHAQEPLELVREVLAPHGLTLNFVEGLYVVARASRPSAATAPPSNVTITVRDAETGALIVAPVIEGVSTGLAVETLPDGRLRVSGATRRYGITVGTPGYVPQRISVPIVPGSSDLDVALSPLPAAVPEVVVTASRYELVRELVTTPFYVDRRTIEQQPDFGDDPLRAVHRLPGAASGVSAKAHVRGGALDETAVELNGQRLLDPFHIRDYQSMFSAIDARAMDGMQVYTGGFPARYGDSIGALVLIDALDPHEPRHSELEVSVLSTSVLSAGTIGDGTGSWLLSGRRSNLEHVVHERLGEPAYYDVFGEIEVNFSARTQVSVNALTARDRVLLVTEADPLELEQSSNDTRNNTFWVHWQQQWSNGLTSSTTFASGSFESTRAATADDPEKIVAALTDRRDIEIASARQDWELELGPEHTLSFGGEYQRLRADYAYRASAHYHGSYLLFPGIAPALHRSATLSPDGQRTALYVADRWRIGERAIAEVGLRRDRYAYSRLREEAKLSPRISVRHDLTPATALRWAVGRYFQAQGLHELQVEDGVTTFEPAQRAEQVVLGVEHQLGERYLVRAEVYRKELDRLRPRFENVFDPLAVLPELEPDRMRVAPDGATARGIELSLAYADAAGMQWWASYVYAHVWDQVAGETVARSWDQRHAAQIGVARESGPWNLAAVLAYHSGWPTTGLTLQQSQGTTTAVIGPRNAQRLGGYSSLDVRANRRIPLRVGALDVFVEISNATNRENPCCADFDIEQDGNGFFLEAETDTWLPRLATFGARWQF
jgi:hypothetical protein